jgi:glutamate-5-semialdehyde dehydrogenase
MATAITPVAEACAHAKRAARVLGQLDTATKDAALYEIADALGARSDEILAANERDLEAARAAEIASALLDRLMLDDARIRAIADAVRDIAALPDPVGEVIGGRRLANGLQMRKVRVPLGVIAVVYEARPNVTIDAAALCVKSGNAIVLRGSATAEHSNAVLAQIAAAAASTAGLPGGAIGLVAGGGREELAELATQSATVDLIIPRGGEGLKHALEEVATVPVIYAASGNCHVYVDASADEDQALAIVMNAKTQRPGVCNAAETLLVHSAIAPSFLPRALAALGEADVEVRADERVLALCGGEAANGSRAGARAPAIVRASEEDWSTEYLDLTLAVGVVDSVGEAIDHIASYGSGHSEAIVTRDVTAARAFQAGVDAACVYVNASTRFTDGGEFGMGAEIGNSTQKLHARGPIGLRELCTSKYLIEGEGHVRT